jgi:REP element-mobilizing transposase RayT
MARPLRIEFEGALYHVTSRGNEKKDIFLDNKDRGMFLDILADVTAKYNWLCHAYCLMNNHYHLLIETPEGNLSRGMRQLNGIYTQRFNKRHGRVGHLFQGRYKAILVDKEGYLLEVARYIVLNPVRAGIVDKPGKWEWSSFRATGFNKRPHSCLTVQWILNQFSEDIGIAKREYVKFVLAGIGKESIWKELKAQVILGGEGFIEMVKTMLQQRGRNKEVPKTQRYVWRPSLEEIFTEQVQRNRELRNKKITEAVYKYGYTQAEVADYLGVHYSTISKVLNNSRFKT